MKYFLLLTIIASNITVYAMQSKSYSKQQNNLTIFNPQSFPVNTFKPINTLKKKPEKKYSNATRILPQSLYQIKKDATSQFTNQIEQDACDKKLSEIAQKIAECDTYELLIKDTPSSRTRTRSSKRKKEIATTTRIANNFIESSAEKDTTIDNIILDIEQTRFELEEFRREQEQEITNKENLGINIASNIDVFIQAINTRNGAAFDLACNLPHYRPAQLFVHMVRSKYSPQQIKDAINATSCLSNEIDPELFAYSVALCETFGTKSQSDIRKIQSELKYIQWHL